MPPPISNLPPELLSEIFALCLSPEPFPVPSAREGPLLLSQICSQWRELAISTPALWAALHINYKDPTQDVAAAELWLSRSADRPLSLSIAIDFNESPQQAILDLLCTHARHWAHVRLDFRHLFCPPMYTLQTALHNLPMLRTFEFHARDISSGNVSQVTELLSSAHNLREVTWVDDLADTETLLELPLGRLTRLSLAMEYGSLDYLTLLHRCSNLEHIRITRPLAVPTQQPRAPLFLSKLSSLNISYDLTAILDHLILPSLSEVRVYSDSDKHPASHPYSHSPHVHVHSYPYLPLPLPLPLPSSSSPSPVETWNPSALLSLIDRSSCVITQLEISAPMLEDPLLLCLKRTSESLVRLHVKNGLPLGDNFVRSLTRRGEEEEGDCVCPRLEEISLDTKVGCALGGLATMVESRLDLSGSGLGAEETESCALLKKLCIVDGHRDLQRLNELVKQSVGHGFSVHVIPRKTIAQLPRNHFFRRKVCASR